MAFKKVKGAMRETVERRLREGIRLLTEQVTLARIAQYRALDIHRKDRDEPDVKRALDLAFDLEAIARRHLDAILNALAVLLWRGEVDFDEARLTNALAAAEGPKPEAPPAPPTPAKASPASPVSPVRVSEVRPRRTHFDPREAMGDATTAQLDFSEARVPAFTAPSRGPLLLPESTDDETET